MGEHGRVWLDVHDDTSRLGEALELERLGWKQQAGTAIASRPETQRFYTEVAHWASQRGWLRLIFLRVDKRAVAFQFALEDGRAHLGLKSGFDPAFRAMSPGRLIVEASPERSCAIGLERFEFMGTADAYKLRSASEAELGTSQSIAAVCGAGRNRCSRAETPHTSVGGERVG